MQTACSMQICITTALKRALNTNHRRDCIITRSAPGTFRAYVAGTLRLAQVGFERKAQCLDVATKLGFGEQAAIVQP